MSTDVRFGTHSGLKTEMTALPKCAITGSQLIIDRFVGDPRQASRLHEQKKAVRFSSTSSHNIGPTVILLHFWRCFFGLTGPSKRNLIAE
jgi:hypothetical protein